jgi:hypothetical protein
MSAGIVEPIELIEPWIYGRLLADDALLALIGGIDHVSGTLSSTELVPPYVTFLMNSTADVIAGAGGDRISTENLYVIKSVVASGSWDDVTPIAKRIDALFHLPYATVTYEALGVVTSIRERVISYPEVDDGVQYRHLGGIYRIRASAGI